MGISFKDSLSHQNKQPAVVKAMAIELPVVQAAINENDFTPCTDGRYDIYKQYTDENCSTVDALKNVQVDSNQVNITQEVNSQYIPFSIPRYWDGIDLMNMFIQFHYVNKDGASGISNAVNVRYNDNTILCAWLIDDNVTSAPGDVTFEITATGVNEKGNNYLWKSRPNGKLTVLEALSYDGVIKPTDDNDFIRSRGKKVFRCSSCFCRFY